MRKALCPFGGAPAPQSPISFHFVRTITYFESFRAGEHPLGGISPGQQPISRRFCRASTLQFAQDITRQDALCLRNPLGRGQVHGQSSSAVANGKSPRVTRAGGESARGHRMKTSVAPEGIALFGGGGDESVRRGAGSQWIVAARPLCHLQCPVAYLSRLQRIRPAVRSE